MSESGFAGLKDEQDNTFGNRKNLSKQNPVYPEIRY